MRQYLLRYHASVAGLAAHVVHNDSLRNQNPSGFKTFRMRTSIVT